MWLICQADNCATAVAALAAALAAVVMAFVAIRWNDLRHLERRIERRRRQELDEEDDA